VIEVLLKRDNFRRIPMGRFTDDMALLRSNLDSSRENRVAQQNARISNVSAQIADFASTRARNGLQDANDRAAFVAGNANDVNRLLNTFHHLHQTMGRQGREERAAFVNDVSKQTRGLLNSFHAAHKNMAKHSAKERAHFVGNNRKTVGAFINGAAQDRAGAHAVFFGTAKKKVAFQV
jgi:hypothetical protein